MRIETATMSGPNQKPTPRYQALSSGRPQDPTLQEQAMGIAKKKAMEKGEEFAMPMLENVFGNIKNAFTGASTAAPVAEGAVTQAAGTGAMAGLGAAVPYIGAAMLAGKAFGLFNKGGYVNGPLSNTSYKADGGNIRGIEQSLATGKQQDMSKGPLGLLNLFVKGIDSLTGYDRDNEVRADLPKAKENMFINKRRNPYTGEYPITEEEYQRVMGKEPVNLSMGGMTNPLSKVRYKQSGGPVNEEIEVSYGGPLSKGV